MYLGIPYLSMKSKLKHHLNGCFEHATGTEIFYYIERRPSRRQARAYSDSVRIKHINETNILLGPVFTINWLKNEPTKNCRTYQASHITEYFPFSDLFVSFLSRLGREMESFVKYCRMTLATAKNCLITFELEELNDKNTLHIWKITISLIISSIFAMHLISFFPLGCNLTRLHVTSFS